MKSSELLDTWQGDPPTEAAETPALPFSARLRIRMCPHLTSRVEKRRQVGAVQSTGAHTNLITRFRFGACLESLVCAGRTSLLMAAALLLVGCQTPPQPVTDSVRAAIQERTHTVFEQAILLKPTSDDTNAMRLAPLIFQEVTPDSPAPPIPTSVFTWTRQGQLSGHPVDQVIYAWSYGDDSWQDQGVRITLNQDGLPILWEALRDESGLRIIYVAQSLEAQAMGGFPAPLPGHRYWIEPATEQSPQTVIASVLDETGTPMGPIVYLEAGDASATTIICRCMDAQANELTETRTYKLINLDRSDSKQSKKLWKSFAESVPPKDFSRILRLP